MNSAVIDIMIKTIRAIKSNCKSLLIAEENFVIKEQSVPLMFDKLGKLCRYLTYQISREKDAHSKFLLLRDRTYFSVVCHSGDRGGDLGLLSSTRLYQLPRGEGVFVSQTVGKHFSLDNPNNFILFSSKDLSRKAPQGIFRFRRKHETQPS